VRTHPEVHNKIFDLAIVGGGIAGLGIAQEAAEKGFSCLVLEKNSCLSQTSNNSLRIIHGGFRYLQSLNIRRTLSSLQEQTFLLEKYSAYIKPLPCAMPLSRYGLKSRYPALLASKFYQALSHVAAGKRQLRKGAVISSEEVARSIPVLKNLAPNGALIWHDGLIQNTEGLSLQIRKDLESLNAHIHENTEVHMIQRQKGQFTITCQSDEASTDFYARIVVNAAGPWILSVRDRLSEPPNFLRPAWCTAFNIVLKKQLEPAYAFGLMGEENRLFFTVPRDSRSVIGTFYLPCPELSEPISISETHILDALKAFNKVLPSASLMLNDIDTIEAGRLPLKALKNGNFELYGSEKIQAQNRYIEVLSTKYTTFRSQARKVMKFVGKEMRNA